MTTENGFQSRNACPAVRRSMRNGRGTTAGTRRPPADSAFRLLRSRHSRVCAHDWRVRSSIGRLVMSTRERICALEMRRGGLLLTTLRTAEGVRHVRELDAPNLPPADSRMLDIAGKLIEQQAGDFDPSEFKQRYEDALRALIQQKAKGR